MFARLFRPRWQHKDPAIRCLAVAELSSQDAEQAGVLATLARGDEDAGVRAAVCARLTDLSLLDRIIHQDRDPSVVAAASAQVKALLAGQVPEGPGLENRLRLLGLTDNQTVLVYVARHCADAPCREMAVARVDQQPLLAELATGDVPEDVQLAACERIDDETVLRRIIKSASAKRLQRQARDRLKLLQQQQEHQRALLQKQAQLQDQLQWLQAHPGDALFEGRLNQARQHWQHLNDEAPELAAALQPALQQCEQQWQQRLDEHQAQQARADALVEQQQAVDQLTRLRDRLSPADWSHWQQLRAAVDTQVQRWQTACESIDPPAPLLASYTALLNAWQQALDLADQAAEANPQAWPDGFARPETLDTPAPVAASQPARDAPAADKPDRESQRLLGQLDQALRQRQLKRANRCWQRLQEHLGDAASEARWSSRLARHQQQLTELRDWHQFAAHPKKEALCRDMELLAEQPLPAEEQAGAIHALHDAWKELMSADQEADQALWDRFKAASDAAWEPCREHYAALDVERAENLKRRQSLCQQLHDFVERVDWDHADWPAILELRQTAPREWQTLKPVRFTDARDVNKRFSQLLARMDEQLDRINEVHGQELERLIEQASALASADDPFSSANECKQLQDKWKRAGWVKPQLYHKLHRRFRREADRIFQARDARQASDRQQRQAQQQALLSQAESLQALISSPREKVDPAAVQQQLDQLRDDLRQSDLRNPPASVSKAMDEARALLLRLPEWRRWQRLLEEIRQCPEGDTDLPAQRQLAVAFEVISGVESPPDAQQERTEWQIARLSRAMTGGGSDAPLAQCQDHWQTSAPAALEPGIRGRLLTALAGLEPR